MVTILSALLIFWLTAGVAVLMLQYGPGRSFYEFSTSILLEIPPQQWTRKADNYLMATLFLESHGAAERWLCALLWPHSSADGGQELANLQFLHSGYPFYACSDLVESLGVQLYLPSELLFGGVAEDEPSTSQQTGGWRDLFQGQLGRLLLGPTDVELQKPGASVLGDPSEQCQLTSQLGGEKQYPSAQGPF